MMRKCGECSVCCIVGYVPEIEKPAHTPCPFIKTDKCGSCSIFDSPDLPKVCQTYKCSWLNGYGNENDRPDKSGYMLTDNILENQRYFTLIETQEESWIKLKYGPLLSIAAEISEKTKIPIIGVHYGKKPPHDTGDYVIIHDDTLPRCSRIAGEKLFTLKSNIGVYELIKGN